MKPEFKTAKRGTIRGVLTIYRGVPPFNYKKGGYVLARFEIHRRPRLNWGESTYRALSVPPYTMASYPTSVAICAKNIKATVLKSGDMGWFRFLGEIFINGHKVPVDYRGSIGTTGADMLVSKKHVYKKDSTTLETFCLAQPII